MTENLRAPTQRPPLAGGTGSLHALASSLPVGTFTASVLLDVLGLVSVNPEQAQSYQRGGADLLTRALSGVLASVGLELVDTLLAPASRTDAGARLLVYDAGIIAVYLLDVAVRRKQLGDRRPRATFDATALGLSLLGLTLLGMSGKRK